jgi:hypothetical protein
MHEAPTTWALAVGINQYDDPNTCKPLAGAVADAVSAVAWLRRLGVPSKQIFLHASPSTPASLAALAGIDVPWKPAYEADIWRSVVALRQAGENGLGTRLFVFLSGHGLYEPSSGPLFLTQEASSTDGMANLGIDKYCQHFRSFRFRRQFLFMDGCQNYPYAETRRQTVEPAMHSGVVPGVPRPENAMFACFAASQGQIALELDDRGSFFQVLLPALDPSSPQFAEALHLDFETGARTLDLRKLFSYSRDAVVNLVRSKTRNNPRLQVPRAQPHGAGESEDEWSLLRLPDPPLSAVKLDVAPFHAIQDVTQIKLWVDGSQWQLRLPRPLTELEMPFVGQVPKGLRASAVCSVQPTAPWDLVQSRSDFSTDTDQTVTFQLQSRVILESLPGADQASEIHSIKFFDANGTRFGRDHDYYTAAARRLGVSSPPPHSVHAIGDGVRIITHEDGPDFEIDPANLESGLRALSDWAEALREDLPPDTSMATILRGNAVLPTSAMLRFVLPPGGARALAGQLDHHPSVVVEPVDQPYQGPAWRSDRGISLADLAEHPVMPVEAGPARVRVDLPWGSWSAIVQVPTSGEVAVVLPTAVGVPPLRVAIVEELSYHGNRIIGVSGSRPDGHVRSTLNSEEAVPLSSEPVRTSAWHLVLPSSAEPTARRVWLVVLDGAAEQTVFPMRGGRPLAVDLSPGAVRVEPLSTIRSPEWDLLVSSGLLDALTVDDTVQLARSKWDDDLLGLAGAYAVFALGRWDYLVEVVDNLSSIAAPTPDLDLLTVAAHEHGNETLSADARERLGGLAEWREVPLFRWGVGLALDLLGRAGDDPTLSAWGRELDEIRRRLSPTSVWTAWTVPRTRRTRRKARPDASGASGTSPRG